MGLFTAPGRLDDGAAQPFFDHTASEMRRNLLATEYFTQEFGLFGHADSTLMSVCFFGSWIQSTLVIENLLVKPAVNHSDNTLCGPATSALLPIQRLS